MTDETKKLFDAPWRAIEHDYDNWFSIIDSVGFECVRDIPYKEDAVRLACLPELYNALVEATKEYCQKCMGRDYRVLLAIPFDYDVIERGCPVLVDVKAEAHCPAARWIELLRKVRGGK